MSISTDLITKRIKHIRKSKRRSIHDCAKILGISRETYLGIEAGTLSLSLPELELLAIYLGINPSDILNEDEHHPLLTAYLDEDVRPHYLNLREKMIRAQFAAQRNQKTLTLEEMTDATQIPLEDLLAYENGDEPIPLEDLIKLSDYLEIPLHTLHEPIWEITAIPDKAETVDHWQPEPLRVEREDGSHEEDPYIQLMNALKKLPMQDQAEISKLLLGKLRT